MKTAEYPFVEPVRHWPKMKNRNAVSIAITTREDAELDERARRSASSRLVRSVRCCAAAVDRPEQPVLEAVGVQQDALVPVLSRVGADISDDGRHPELGGNVGQAEFLAVRAALGGDLRQVLRIAISLGYRA